MEDFDPFACLQAGPRAAKLWNDWRKLDGRPPVLDKLRLAGIDLSGFDLSGISLKYADLGGARLLETALEGADLTGANLRGARLEGARLNGATLTNARLDGATLTWADFAGADLRNATFDGAQARTTNWSFANLAGTALPEVADRVTQDVLVAARESTTHARAALIALMTACAYCLLSSANTTDGNLVSNIGVLALPVVGIEVSVHRFFALAPVVLIALFVYFHIYLSHLSALAIKLPARFPDGARLGERLHPWMLNIVIENRLQSIRFGDDAILESWANGPERSAWRSMQSLVGMFLAWGLAPLTCTWLLWSVRVSSQALLVWWLYALALTSWIATAVLLFREGRRAKRTSARRVPRASQAVTIIAGFAGLLLATGFAVRASGAKRLAWAITADRRAHEPTSHRIERLFRPDLRGAELEGAELRARDLRAIRVDRAVLKGADLRGTDLMGAILWRANLEGAALVKAQLGYAQLTEANLTSVAADSASFEGAYLQEALLVRAKLNRAKLSGARLIAVHADQVHLSGADLSRADLTRAALTEADLEGSSLSCADLSKATLHRANLKEADLRGADLRRADLAEADLSGANLASACLDGAALRGLQCDPRTSWPTASRPTHDVSEECSLAYTMTKESPEPEPECKAYCRRKPSDGNDELSSR